MPQRKQKTVKPVTRAYSAGGAVYKRENGKIYWLLIKPRGKDRWQLPKGTIDKGESSKEAALREVHEETGVWAEIIEKIADAKFFFVFQTEKIFKTVTFFLMKYVSGKPSVVPEFEKEIEDVKWMETKEALDSITFKDEREIIQKGFESLRMART